MLILLTFSVIGIGSLIYSYWERNQLKVESYRIVSAKIKKKCRFIFLTDLHEKKFGKENCILLEKIRKAEPDFILIGGDPRRKQMKGMRRKLEQNCFLL